MLFCTKNISAIAMTCNMEPHLQCIWSIETESNRVEEEEGWKKMEEDRVVLTNPVFVS